MNPLHLTAVIRSDDELFTSWCPEIDVASQGETREEALFNLKEAIELCLETEPIRTQILENLHGIVNTCPELHCLEINTDIKATRGTLS